MQRCWLNANPVVLDDSDWLKIKVRIGATSWLVSFNIRGEIPSGPIDFYQVGIVALVYLELLLGCRACLDTMKY